MAMEIELHEGPVDSLLPEWGELFAADHRATPFQSPAWARAWWRWWADGARPWTLVIRDAGQVIGLMPLVRRQTASLRVLRVLGEEPADYWDVLALPDRRPAIEKAMASELYRRCDEWDALIVKRLPADSATPGALAQSGLRTAELPATVCPGMKLPATWDDYLATLTPKARTNMRRRLRTLDTGELHVRNVNVEDLPDALRRWQDIRIRQWSERDRELAPAHRSDAFREFLVDVMTALVPEGLALAWEFLHDGDVVGVYINFCDERTFYQYLGGFEPELRSLGIGRVATAYGIRTSIAAGRQYYDFTRGDEPYKYTFGAVDRASPAMVVTSRRIRSRAALTLGSVSGRLR
jgi:CelD/BcsL family acetyltransferase involved in cellulose biosynthesis